MFSEFQEFFVESSEKACTVCQIACKDKKKVILKKWIGILSQYVHEVFMLCFLLTYFTDIKSMEFLETVGESLKQ